MKIKLDSPSLSSQPWCNSDLMNQKLYPAHGWGTNCQNLVVEITSHIYVCWQFVTCDKKRYPASFPCYSHNNRPFCVCHSKNRKSQKQGFNDLTVDSFESHSCPTTAVSPECDEEHAGGVLNFSNICLHLIFHFSHWALPLTHELLMGVKTTKCFNNKWSIHVSFLMLNHIFLNRF